MRETETVERLIAMEDLAEKKAKIYSRLLTEVALAKEMEELSLEHEKRKKTLKSLIFEKGDKKNET